MTRGPVTALGTLAAANAIAWAWAAIAFAHTPSLLGSALLAWLFGLRHAADADHLAAIDNVVRKLMQDGQRPHLVGLFFSLGHSSVVLLACLLIAANASSNLIDPLRILGGMVGTAVSAAFLIVIAAVNLVLLLRLVRDSEAGAEQDQLMNGRGILARILRPAARMVRRPAHMFPVGFLFGLGFDTATEIGLLALSATQAASGLSVAQVLVFPSLFTAGMALIDTADSVMMVGAYGWALSDPRRKRTYNLGVTALSVLLAAGIGGIEAAGLLSNQLALHGWGWSLASSAGDHLGQAGFVVIALFLLAWGLSAWRYRRAPALAYNRRHPPAGPSGDP
ncbi:MAG TPA: HoxN/HupN/NixA family nickel/cobalt transporter [Rhodopila sp.]|nr:HoxN/HupN/NixA family nickel/cobalt transporter [Rhodopila sp.]